MDNQQKINGEAKQPETDNLNAEVSNDGAQLQLVQESNVRAGELLALKAQAYELILAMAKEQERTKKILSQLQAALTETEQRIASLQ